MDKEFGNQAILKVLRESGVSYVVGYKNHGIFADIKPPSKAPTWVAKTALFFSFYILHVGIWLLG
jgi:hypothetical protein